MSQESRTPRIHIKRCVELSSLQNEPSSAHNEPESSETSKKSVDISSLKEKYNIRLLRSYKEQTSAPQTVHFSEELESTIPETVDELKTENQKLKKKIAELKRQNSQMEIDFEEKLEKSQENINQMKKEIDFLANINQQFGDSGTESEIIPSKRLKGRKLKSKKIAKTNKGKRVFSNDSKEDTESDDEKNEKDTRNEMKTIIKTINSEFKLQKSLALKFRLSVTQLTKWLNNLRRVHVNNQQNNKKLRRIKAAKELFRKNDPNITDYDKESLLRMLADCAFLFPGESRTPRIHIKRCVELSSLQNEPSSAHNEPESSETSKKSVDISSLKEKYNIRLLRSYKEQTSAPQTVHFSEELESTIPETVDELKTENQKLKKKIAELKRQNSQMEIDFEEKLEKSQENINQMKKEIDFLANINQQFGDSGTESEIIPSKRLKGRKLKSKKIAKTNKGKRVFSNDSKEDTESDDEKNEKDTRNEMKTIIKTINSEFKLQKSLALKFRLSVTQLTKWLNNLRRVHVNNQQNNKKLRRIKAAKELFRKNDPNITDYDKESLLRMLADCAFLFPGGLRRTGYKPNNHKLKHLTARPIVAPVLPKQLMVMPPPIPF
ncbi:hypothetical protein Glove_132g145 [Diversispora epigaea]|uniref:Uncharacterized protein n=1 Tax=Diversispora epigaea TaxID=1348612 RepID=A0A397IXK5_9GLOM|nr:hypothetical protein Glove_132g145 [Diversispora epigaea]